MMNAEGEVECTNKACLWKGHVWDCVRLANDPKKLTRCPKCKGTIDDSIPDLEVLMRRANG